MWLSEQIARTAPSAATVAEGTVTVGGQTPAVLTDGEERDVRVVSPGGYYWRPAVGSEVLLSRQGTAAVLGRLQERCDLLPGEVCIRTGKAAIRLLPDGSIYLEGDLYLNGEKWEGTEL